MKQLFCSCLLVVTMSACTTQSKSRVQVPPTYVTGEQAMAQSLAQRSAVLVRGDVKTPLILWTNGLTLARAILAAEYRALSDPHTILIIRAGQTYKINPKHLLSGREDPPLEPGDIVAIQR
jgi:hypothetical protein